MLIVRTKEELKRAKKNKIGQFIVVGELAEKLKKSQNIAKLSKRAAIGLAGAVGVGVAAAPFSAGTSLGASAVVATGAAASAGVSASVIMASIAVGGILLAFAIFKDYNVSFKMGPNGIEGNCTKK